MEPLIKGKAQYGWPLCTNKFRVAHFYIKNIIYLLAKKLPKEEVKRTWAYSFI